MERIVHNEGNWIFPFVEYSGRKNNEKQLPLIVQLHGAGERGNGKEEIYKVETHGFAKHLQENEYECIVVMPQCPKDSFWVARVESIINFIEQIKAEFNINEKKIYLTGLSMGGYGTWFTAMAKPEMFAAIAPVCGGGMAWNAAVLNMPIWTFHGAVDHVVSPQQTDEMVEKLELLGKDVNYTRLDNVGHNVWEYTYNKELMLWLLDKES